MTSDALNAELRTPNSRRKWLLAECTYADFKESLPDVAVIPFGATEPHNLHLPYATDCIEADLVGEAICRAAHERGAWCVCLPTVPFGTETNQHRYPFAMNLQPSTVLAVLRDLVESLERTGVRKCVILNSHGGNEFKGHLRELFGRTEVQLFLCDWFTVGKDRYKEFFTHDDDHAGEMETSLILHARPELVDLAAADPGAVAALRFEALRKGWVKMTRPWHLLTTNSGAGDPRQATAEKGERFLALLVERLSGFLVELARSPLDERFPFE
jgi:creatinine amidohydrolase